MAEWTTARVQDRLELAADVFRSLPGVKPQGYFSAWPEYFHSFADKVSQEPRMRRPLPSPRMITEALDALGIPARAAVPLQRELHRLHDAPPASLRSSVVEKSAGAPSGTPTPSKPEASIWA
jgi:hypothetical protein